MLRKLAAFKANEAWALPGPSGAPCRPEAGQVGRQPAAVQEEARRREAEPEDHGRAGGQAEAIGFDWSANFFRFGTSIDEAGWETMLARLAAFNAEHGHCRVPTNPGAHEPFIIEVLKYRTCYRGACAYPTHTATRVKYRTKYLL